MDCATLPLKEKIRILDADAARIRAAHPEKYQTAEAERDESIAIVKECHTIPELEAKLRDLAHQRQEIEARLTSYAADLSICSRDGVIGARAAWERIRGYEMKRGFELEEALVHGRVLRGSWNRAEKRLQRMADEETATAAANAERREQQAEE